MTVSQWVNEFDTAGRAAGKSRFEIASVVSEVRSHCMDGAEDPYDSFGTPAEYLRELGWNAQVSRLGLRRGRIALTAIGFVGGLLIAGSALAWIDKGLFGVNVPNLVLVPISAVLIGLIVDGGRRLLAEREVAALLGICLVLVAGTAQSFRLGFIPLGGIIILPRKAMFFVGGALVLTALLGHWVHRRERRGVGRGHSSKPPTLSIVSDSAGPANRHRSAGRTSVEQPNQTGKIS